MRIRGLSLIGHFLNDYEIAFKTFGKLNKKKSNAILICHALTETNFVQEKIL